MVYVRCARGIVLIAVRETALILKARVLREPKARRNPGSRQTSPLSRTLDDVVPSTHLSRKDLV